MASAGAAEAAVHINGTEWLLATANGGIWRTDDVTAAPEPRWTQMLDAAPVTCTSVSAMSTAVAGTVLAGCGAATSSEMGVTWDVANSGDWGGVMLSRDGGKTWAMTGFPANYYVSSLVVVDAQTFFVGVRSHVYDQKDGGVYKSADGGATWAKVFEKPVFDLRCALPPSPRIDRSTPPSRAAPPLPPPLLQTGRRICSRRCRGRRTRRRSTSHRTAAPPSSPGPPGWRGAAVFPSTRTLRWARAWSSSAPSLSTQRTSPTPRQPAASNPSAPASSSTTTSTASSHVTAGRASSAALSPSSRPPPPKPAGRPCPTRLASTAMGCQRTAWPSSS